MNNQGSIITLVLVFGSIFLLLLSGLLGFILLQLRQSAQRLAWNSALHIAEAGTNYYRWCLNNGIEGDCLGEKEYLNADGSLIGRFSVAESSEASCGGTTKRTINSTGWTYQFPNTKRAAQVLYSRASVAKYAYLINDNVWAGADREIRGLYHSNGGIRMDGENQSVVSSAKEDWICTSSFGCSTCPEEDGCSWTEGPDPDCVCPGVFTTTANPNSGLFDFPVASFDFDGITVDLAEMKAISQTEPGSVYLPPSTDLNPDGLGYHLIFQNNGTFDVWLITDLDRTRAYSSEEGWHWDYFTISQEEPFNPSSYSVDENCSLVFVEDNLWIEGTVRGKVTVASANLIEPTEDTNVVLPGDIEYTALDGSDGFSVIAEDNVLISPVSPDEMELRGIFVAQKGHFGRNHYTGNLRTSLELTGSVVSNGRVGTKWSSGGIPVSGYLQRENYFDSNLVYSPPPFVPYTSVDFEIVEWNEID